MGRPVARRDRIVVSTLRCGRSNPGSNPNPGHGKFFWVPLKLPPLLTPSFRPHFCARRVPLTCSGCSSELKLGPSLRARAPRFEPLEKRLKTKRSYLVWKNLASERIWCVCIFEELGVSTLAGCYLECRGLAICSKQLRTFDASLQ